jgi:distribution and morphology protein 31
MSGIMKGKLFAHFWESASPFFSSAVRQRPLASRPSTCPNFAPRAFSQNNPKYTFAFPRKNPRNAVRRSFASGGILLLGLNPTATATNSAICTNVIEKALGTPKTFERRKAMFLGSYIWCRAIHSSSRQRGKEGTGKDGNSSKEIHDHGNLAKDMKQTGQPKPATRQPENDAVGRPTAPVDTPGTNSYFHLPHLPKMPHRPTKEELLAAATGFWSRLRVRFKWFSIRSVRPWNVDDWSAFASWLLVGHIVWILIGTTTFFSLLIFAINTVAAQGSLFHPRKLYNLLIPYCRNFSSMDWRLPYKLGRC